MFKGQYHEYMDRYIICSGVCDAVALFIQHYMLYGSYPSRGVCADQ